MGASATPVPDLVHDSQIETYITGKITKHILYKPGERSNERQRSRVECWEREHVLGQGAYGTVYRERRYQNGAVCALRAVKEISKRAHAGERLDYERELEAIAKFSHSNYSHCFVRSEGWFESGDSIFITMEYIRYGDLQKLLTQYLPESEVRNIAGQLLEGLTFMHKNGFVHRDLKPSNIMVVAKGPDWFVKIADFGISKRRHEGVTTLHTLQRGTLGFAAPEVLGVNKGRSRDSSGSGGSYTFAVDMWSLGAVVYYMLTLRMVFENAADIIMYAMGLLAFPDSPAQWEELSPTGQSFTRGLLDADPGLRPTAPAAAAHKWLRPELAMSTVNDGLDSAGAVILTSATGASSASVAWSEVVESTTARFSARPESRTTRYLAPTVEEVTDEEAPGQGKDTLKDALKDALMDALADAQDTAKTIRQPIPVTSIPEWEHAHSHYSSRRSDTRHDQDPVSSSNNAVPTDGPSLQTTNRDKPDECGSSEPEPVVSTKSPAYTHSDDQARTIKPIDHDSPLQLPDDLVRTRGSEEAIESDAGTFHPDDAVSTANVKPRSSRPPFVLNMRREMVYFPVRTKYFVDTTGKIWPAPERTTSPAAFGRRTEPASLAQGTRPSPRSVCWQASGRPYSLSRRSWLALGSKRDSVGELVYCCVCSGASGEVELLRLPCHHRHCLQCVEWAWMLVATDARFNLPTCCGGLVPIPAPSGHDATLAKVKDIYGARNRLTCCGCFFIPEFVERDPLNGEWVACCPRCSRAYCFICTHALLPSLRHDTHVFGCSARKPMRDAMSHYLKKQDPTGDILFAETHRDPPGVRLFNTRPSTKSEPDAEVDIKRQLDMASGSGLVRGVALYQEQRIMSKEEFVKILTLPTNAWT